MIMEEMFTSVLGPHWHCTRLSMAK